jgi:hypothetical protein
MIDFHCPSCRMGLRVPDNRARRRVKCPFCFRSASVPERMEEMAPTPAGRPVRLLVLAGPLVALLAGLLLWYCLHG